jgi:hypothetical protein
MYRARAATLNKDLSGSTFTLEELEKLATGSKNVPISYGFDYTKIIGAVTNVYVKDNILFVEFNIKERYAAIGKLVDLYIVPGYDAPSFTAVCYGLTHFPADESLIPINLEIELYDEQ